ncbi:M23 family metallopeptidase [Streptomyces boluensis]|nr:M23 family metallopeptidase [Streptomyces boluensis]
MGNEVSDHSTAPDSGAPPASRRRALGLAAGLLGAGALGFRMPVPESALRAPADLTGACTAYYDQEYEDLLAMVDEAQFDLSDLDLPDPADVVEGVEGAGGACAGTGRGALAPNDGTLWSPEQASAWAREAVPTGPWSWTGGPEGRTAADDRVLCPDAPDVPGTSAAGPEAGRGVGAPTRPWARPLTRRYRITTGYRVRGNWLAGYHTGVDLAVPHGTPVWAVGAGVVVLARWSGAYGKAVTIRMRDGRYVLYAHLSRIAVRPGMRVYAGRRIGNSGNTGRSTGPHLHLEIRARRGYGSDINPIRYLAQRGIRV